MPEGVGLGLERLHQHRVAVAQAVDGDAAGEVDVLPTRLVPQAAALAAHRNRLLGGIVGHHVAVEIGAGRGLAHVAGPLCMMGWHHRV